MTSDIPSIKHSNGYCIALLIITILSFILGFFLMFYGDLLMIELSFYVTILIITLILVMDREHLKAVYPDRKMFIGLSVILVPWYLYQRAKFLGTRQTFLLIWAGVMVLGVGVDYFLEKLYGGLPSCDDPDVVVAVNEIVNNMGFHFVSVTDIQELSFDEDSQLRICQGVVTTAYDTEEGKYLIYWGNGNRSNYVVELIPVYQY